MTSTATATATAAAEINRLISDGKACGLCCNVRWHDNDCPAKNNSKLIDNHTLCELLAARKKMQPDKFSREFLNKCESKELERIAQMVGCKSVTNDAHRKIIKAIRKAIFHYNQFGKKPSEVES